MLLLRKAELERSLQEAAARLRHIESRLQQIDERGAIADYDIVLKSAPAQPFLSVRSMFAGMGEVMAALGEVTRAGTARIASHARGPMTVVAHSDFDDQDLDLEIGFLLTRNAAKPLPLPGGAQMTVRELAPADHLATIVRNGPLDQSHLAFGALGIWMEANGYAIAGPCREVFLEMPFARPGAEDMVVEIQFPVTKAA